MARTSRLSVNVVPAYWERSQASQRTFPAFPRSRSRGSWSPETLPARPRAGFYTAYGKRAFDIAGSLGLLVFFGPVILLLLGLTALEGGRPLFGHMRIGRGGKAFPCLKIRSMVTDADVRLRELLARDPEARAEWDRAFKLENDPRITRLGAFLRKTSLDELPQLWNVLRGDMSLVGPRPVPEAELERYGRASEVYMTVRPGVTGLWQVSGRNDVSYARRVAMDICYVRRVSLFGDIGILLATVGAMVNTTGR